MKHTLFFLLTSLLFAACFGSRSSTRTEPQHPVLTPRTTPATSGTSGGSTGNVQLDYVQLYKNAAVREMERTGIPASITLAQGILESASGQSELAVTARNHFGIKCGNDWNGKSHYKQDDDRDANGNPIKSCFRKYENPDESFYDHSEFLRDPRKSNRYGFLFNLDQRDYRNWARGLQSAGYATSSTYADKLIELIERLRLYEYDTPGVVDVAPGGIIPAAPSPQSRISYVNDVKVVNSRTGESLADIARIYGIAPEKVADFNDRAYSPGEYIPAGTRVFIQEKQKSWRGQATHHFVRDNQTMLEIAQLYGIRLSNLLKCNKMQSGEEPANDEKVRLRGKLASGESVRLRSDADNDPVPVSTATTPVSMTPDEDILFEISPDKDKPNQPGTNMGGTIPGKPATSGVPYPPDPVPVTSEPVIPQPPAGTTTTPAPPATTTGPYHVVVKGDTLYSLSRKYGTTVTQIKQWNNLTSDNIKIGQVLRIQ